MTGRCSPTEALQLLMRGGLSAPAAAKRLTNAIHGQDQNVCRLWCDGKLVKSHFAVRLMVEPRDEQGRWAARIVSAVGEAWEKPIYNKNGELEAAPYQWELEIDEVMALLPQPEVEKPWPTVTGSVNWTPPTVLAPATPPPEPDPAPESPSLDIEQILDDLPSRRSVGRPLKHDWRAIYIEIVRRCIDPKTGRVRVAKSERRLARRMLHWCDTTFKKEPAESEMRDAVKDICAVLRPFQK